MNKLTVFILAAGMGERLQPITHHIPKPLLPIIGRPLLLSILEKVTTLPVDTIGINLYHKKKAIESWINQSAFRKKITIFPEEAPLGTGGALKHAETLLSTSPFLVHNADIVSDIDLAALVESHVSSKNLATLAVHDFPEFNTLALDKHGFLKGIQEKRHVPSGKKRKVAFTGIAVYEPEFLKFLSSGTSSVVDAWLNALAEGLKIGTFDISGVYWRDIGTPSAYASMVFKELRSDGEVVYVHPSIENCTYVEMDGYVVIEKDCMLDKDVSLRNCIMLPESRAERNSRYENCILGPDFKIDLKENEIRELSGKDEGQLIGTGGSERKYYRQKRDGKPVVLMQCSDKDPDFKRHIEYTRFFTMHSIPVPELRQVESDKMTAIFEDLGDISLYSWLKCPRKQEQVESMYREVLDTIIVIHSISSEHIADCPTLQNRVFDYEHFRWETDYFIERFFKHIKKINVKSPSVLHEDLHRLALKADSFVKTVIHRDFQSQNIMITQQGIPHLIDYQGARLGPPAYDIVSILWDPYFRLQNDTRESLLHYYIRKMIHTSDKRFNEEDFRGTLLPCRLQRHMQALGAYGFLSAVKGIKHFLKFIPEGLRLLKEDVSLSKGEYPGLFALVEGLEE
jgi:NDP-sugar pyrophosphorylase family protein